MTMTSSCHSGDWARLRRYDPPSWEGDRDVSPRVRQAQATALPVQPAPQMGATIQSRRRRGLFAVHSLRQRTFVLHASGGVGRWGGGWFDQHPGRPARRDRGGLHRAIGRVLEVSTSCNAVVSTSCDAVSIQYRHGPVAGRDRGGHELVYHSRERAGDHRQRQRSDPVRALLLLFR